MSPERAGALATALSLAAERGHRWRVTLLPPRDATSTRRRAVEAAIVPYAAARAREGLGARRCIKADRPDAHFAAAAADTVARPQGVDVPGIAYATTHVKLFPTRPSTSRRVGRVWPRAPGRRSGDDDGRRRGRALFRGSIAAMRVPRTLAPRFTQAHTPSSATCASAAPSTSRASAASGRPRGRAPRALPRVSLPRSSWYFSSADFQPLG